MKIYHGNCGVCILKCILRKQVNKKRLLNLTNDKSYFRLSLRPLYEDTVFSEVYSTYFTSAILRKFQSASSSNLFLEKLS